jgi:ribonuclease HI
MSGRDWLCYTDGSAKTEGGAPGGWGFCIRGPDGAPLEGYGKAVGTLAKVMEYRAVAEALAALPAGVSAIVFSDNIALVENLSKKLDVWRQNGFAKVDTSILDSVRALAASIEEKNLRVRFQWVRAHNGNAGNERADELAALGAREAKVEALRRR